MPRGYSSSSGARRSRCRPSSFDGSNRRSGFSSENAEDGEIGLIEQDQAAIDALIAAFFAAFDNRRGNVPTAREFVVLFGPSALIVTHAAGGPHVATPLAFVEPRIALLTSGALVGFHEWETQSQTEIQGSLAVRRSRYAKDGIHNAQPYAGKGTKHFQLAKLEQGWRITSLSWIDD